MNLLEADVVRDGAGVVCRSGETEIELPLDVVATIPQLEVFVGRRIVLGIRPESIAELDGGAAIRGRVLLVEALGAEQLVHIDIPAISLGRPELVDASAQPAPGLGEDERGRRATILGRFDRSALLRPGEAAAVFVDPRQLHFFDLDTGEALERTLTPAAELAR
jgi:multiple sugar transport system ATP-binding protein